MIGYSFSQLFSRVEVGKGYKVNVEVNITYRHLIVDCSGETVNLKV